MSIDAAIKSHISNNIFEYISFNNSQWLKIFYHNSKNNANFSYESEALYSIEQEKYSIIGIATKFRRMRGKYEFLLYYPAFKDKYNQWKQTIFPLYESDSLPGNTTGYEKIHIDWEDYGWRGLAYNTHISEGASHPSSLLDGSLSSGTWYYAIGKYKDAPGWTGNGIPGPNSSVTEVYLFMKVFDFNHYFITCVAHHQTSFGVLFISIVFCDK